MAKLVLDYYNGQDLYSDGWVEDVILEFVKKHMNFLDFNEKVYRENRYAFLYHLSSVRENILNWYPFEPRCRVLEVGSGCGTITAMLCRKVKWVTSVELSKKRAEINYLRNSEFKNLEIVVGNLNDLKSFGKYDYVIINGVLEYACSFADGANPFETFLKNIGMYLKSNGKILLAIENRLGVKYFAGALEDHTDKSFWGIKKYPGDNTVRTFSKVELQKLLSDSGFKYNRFYYPYPDYKFPTEIYTDININSGDYGRSSINFGKEERRLFNEKILIDSLKDEKILERFANSFLIEASFTEIREEQIIYAKLNSCRREDYAIGTLIKKNERSGMSVVKYALNKRATKHIYKIYKNSRNKMPEGFYNLKGKYFNKEIKFPFIDGETLNAKIGKLIKEGNIKYALEMMKEVFDKILDSVEIREDIYTEEFLNVFGERRINREFECIWNANIDLIFDNIFITPKGYFIIDYEWYIKTWIPKKFIIWRAVNEAYNQGIGINGEITFSDLLNYFEIDEEESICFREWANHFAEDYVLEPKLLKYHVVHDELDVTDYIKDILKHPICTNLYIDTGKGFSEEEKIFENIFLDADGRFEVVFDLSGWKNINALRWDPLEGERIKCENIVYSIDDKPVDFESFNGEPGEEGLFLTLDPQYICTTVMKESELLKIEGNILRLM